MIALEKPVRRMTRGALSEAYGPDRGRKLVASLEAGDLLVMRPTGTRRPETISLFDVYHYALMSRVNCLRLEKARAKKAKLAERRAALKWKRTTSRPAAEGAA